MNWKLIAAVVAVALGLGWWLSRGGEEAEALVIPELSPRAEAGKGLFDASCASCHGANAAGSDKGPPLIHVIYEPNHHADLSFLMAVRQGVRPHHWEFGPMPPVEGLTDAQIAEIVTYVREVQRANGIQ